MLAALLTFGFGLAQVLLDEGIISFRGKVVFSIVVVVLSVIPLILQFVILLGELARARRYSLKLLMHRMLMSILGNYGPSSTLIVKQYREKKIGEYEDPKGRLWSCCLYFAHGVIMPCRGLSFGDAFSGLFAVRHVSVALWMDDRPEPWSGCKEPHIVNDLFSKPHVKSVRDLTLTVQFRPTGPTDEKLPFYPPAEQFMFHPTEDRSTSRSTDEQMTPRSTGGDLTYDVDCHVSATGSRESLISKLYLQKWDLQKCSSENALEFCKLMETLNNDSFVVMSRPPEGNDHILPCEELDVIVKSILRHSKKLNAKRVFGMSYV